MSDEVKQFLFKYQIDGKEDLRAVAEAAARYAVYNPVGDVDAFFEGVSEAFEEIKEQRKSDMKTELKYVSRAFKAFGVKE